MDPDDTLCYCFHIPLRKAVNFYRVERPRRASQITPFCGAGGGCGWCVPLLEHLHAEIAAGREVRRLDLSPEEAKFARFRYHDETGAKPVPGTGREGGSSNQ